MAALLLVAVPALGGETGRGMERIRAGDTDITVFTYRPRDCVDPSILFVFHGLNRRAEVARNNAEIAAEAVCLLVFAPLFDAEQFPHWRYHHAGVVRRGRVQPQEQWTVRVVKLLLDWARRQTNRPDVKIYMFGHSAGGQFLSRLFAYSAIESVDRIVIANPSAYVAPLLTERVPYGFDGIFSAEEAEQRLREYLAQPITVYLGSEDTGEKHLARSEGAQRQGDNRLQRGHAIFNLGQAVAKQRGWSFHWQLVEVPGIRHSARDMLVTPKFLEALRPSGTAGH
jgi:dienelactone hydrolase